MSIEVFGHTDSAGDEKINLQLSAQRAKTVADYLKSKGVHEKSVFYVGLGERFPIASNATSSGREKNRRVEVHLFRPIP